MCIRDRYSGKFVLPDGQKGKCNSSNVNVRTSPTTTSGNNVLFQVHNGYQFTILQEQNGWYQVSFGADRIGWISGLDVTPVSYTHLPYVFDRYKLMPGTYRITFYGTTTDEHFSFETNAQMDSDSFGHLQTAEAFDPDSGKIQATSFEVTVNSGETVQPVSYTHLFLKKVQENWK